MQSEKHPDIHGRCYCGSVRFSIGAGTQPFYAGYCHCRDCRQAHAAPVYQYVYVEKQHFRISEGSESLRWFTRSEAARGNFRRYFCVDCGGRVYNYLRIRKDSTEVELCGTFPSLFDDQRTATSSTWSPRKHVHCAESFLDLSTLQDSLPRF